MTDTTVKIDLNALLDHERREHELIVSRLNGKITELTTALDYEKQLRKTAEEKVLILEQQIKPKRKRRTKAEMEAFRNGTVLEYSEYKSNGVKKKAKTVSVRSYTDFKKIQDYFLTKARRNGEGSPRRLDAIRNYAMWTVGVCFGVRASDLVPLKWKNVLDEAYLFRERVYMYEKKTSKLQQCLITEGVREALKIYLNEMRWEIDFDEQIFPITEKHCYKVLKEAAENTGIEYNIGSHSMRNSFANIALCVDKHTVDMNAITKIQTLLNHSDPKTTMRYLGTLDNMCDRAREAVSNFVLGKTDIDVLEVGESANLDNIMNKLQEIEGKIVKQ